LRCNSQTTGRHLRSLNRWVRLARRKPWLGAENRKRRRIWCRERKHWTRGQWRIGIYTDEVKVQVSAGVDDRRKVRRPPGKEHAFDPRYLQPTFLGKPFGVSFWAAISYNKHSPLVPLHQRGEDERKSDKDKLGFDSDQYCNEILIPYLKPLYEACGGLDSGVQTIEDGAPWHTSTKTTRCRLEHGIVRMR